MFFISCQHLDPQPRVSTMRFNFPDLSQHLGLETCVQAIIHTFLFYFLFFWLWKRVYEQSYMRFLCFIYPRTRICVFLGFFYPLDPFQHHTHRFRHPWHLQVPKRMYEQSYTRFFCIFLKIYILALKHIEEHGSI
jgi:hypothetical protein